MPTISVDEKDFFSLLGRHLTDEELETQLELVKAEWKGRDELGALRIELNDTNRPDLWCGEGISRQLRFKYSPLQKSEVKKRYPFFDSAAVESAAVDSAAVIDQSLWVDCQASVASVRPVIGCFIAEGPPLTEKVLEQLIQTQEKLTDGYGEKRKSVAIGYSRASDITFPLTYEAVNPDAASFIPLGEAVSQTLRGIVANHPKGIEFGHIVSSHAQWPIIRDSQQQIVSFPPVINSSTIGQVEAGDTRLLVDATGLSATRVGLVLNILAANLADRGYRITPLETRFSDGTRETFPLRFSNEAELPVELVTQLSGEELSAQQIRQLLEEYGCIVSELTEVQLGSFSTTPGKLTPGFKIATLPYRDDYLHPVDALEDVLISRGYNSFEPTTPDVFTVGSFHPLTDISDRVRSLCVGAGFEEIFSNILMSREEIIARMSFGDLPGVPPAECIQIENPMTETYGVVRNSLLPCLLRLEGHSSKAAYPHRVFEVGEVALLDSSHPDGSVSPIHAALMVAHPKAKFSELHSILDSIGYYLGFSVSIAPRDLSWAIPGRSGAIVLEANMTSLRSSTPPSEIAKLEVGVIGEVHPGVLHGWGIKVPSIVAEISLSKILTLATKE